MYLHFTSYPSVQKKNNFPVGHPQIYVGNDECRKIDLRNVMAFYWRRKKSSIAKDSEKVIEFFMGKLAQNDNSVVDFLNDYEELAEMLNDNTLELKQASISFRTI